MTVKKGFIAFFLVTLLNIGKLTDGYDITVGNEGSFVNRMVFERFFINIGFETMREIVFLEDHFLDMGWGCICRLGGLGIGWVVSMFFVIGASGLFKG